MNSPATRTGPIALYVALYVALFTLSSHLHAQEDDSAAANETSINETLANQAGAAENSAGKLTIEFQGVSGELLENIKKHVRLVTRIKSDRPMTFGERRRLRKRVPSEIKQALEPYGYYLVRVTNVTSSKTPNKLQYAIQLNQAVKLKRVSLFIGKEENQIAAFGAWQKNFPLSSGDQLNHPSYETAKKELLSTALRLGYFDAVFSKHQIMVNEARTHADLVLVFESGKRYTVDQVNIVWDSESESNSRVKRRVTEEILSPMIAIREGQKFDAELLNKTQANLLTTPYFSSVSVLPGERDRSSATLPVNIQLIAAKRKAYSAEIGVGTDTGARGGIGYENRRINRKGHTLNIRLGGSEISTSAIANYRIPLPRSKNDGLNLFASLEEERGDTRQYEISKVGGELLRDWDGALLKFGLTASREDYFRVVDGGLETEQTTDLLMPSLKWERTKVDDLYFPTEGWSASATFRFASKDVASDINLAQAILDGKRLFPLGKGRLKLRFRLAGSLIDESIDLPESLGFLAGGDDSVRGYRYESIGVARNGETQVGKNLIVGSIEYEHPIKNQFAAATFIDVGDAYDNKIDIKRGVGAGLRWRLPFGALRLDLASALDRDGTPLRLHFSFGTDL